MKVVQRTATSTGMQTYSIIRITDAEIKKEISKVCEQNYVATVPELWIFIVDSYRNNKIAEEKAGKKFEESHDMNRFFQGWTDSVLAAQNLTNAFESQELGGVFLGSILNNSDKICEILELPEMTFPVLGVGFGYANHDPQLKPRMNMELRLFENKYKYFDNYLEEIKEYDKDMEQYYDTRDLNKQSDSFSKQVVLRLENSLDSRAKILNSIKKQGFDLKIEG